MAVVTTKSTAVANADAKPVIFSLPNIARGKIHQSIGFVAAANGDSIASIYRMVRLNANDRLSAVTIFCDAITGAAADVGVYETVANGGGAAGGTAGNTSLFASAQTLATASKTGINVTYAKVALNQMEKRLWEWLGFSADPGRDFDLGLTLTAAAAAAGTVAAHVTSVSGE